jgi:antitoxin component YwqK of YwqJK toxin-antitoxin module
MNRATYRYGKQYGSFENFYPNGKVRENGFYIDGVLHGKYKSFHEDGKVKEEGEYKKGQKICKWKTYDRQGGSSKTNYGEYSPTKNEDGNSKNKVKAN